MWIFINLVLLAIFIVSSIWLYRADIKEKTIIVDGMAVHGFEIK